MTAARTRAFPAVVWYDVLSTLLFPSVAFFMSISFVFFVPFVVHGFGFAHFVNHCEVG
jgi:hypothetical protein